MKSYNYALKKVIRDNYYTKHHNDIGIERLAAKMQLDSGTVGKLLDMRSETPVKADVICRYAEATDEFNNSFMRDIALAVIKVHEQSEKE